MLVFSCKQEETTSKKLNSDVNFEELWVDNTETYLPATKEWTNRVEIADLNDDGRVDLLFANGGNYSEPGEAEYSRIFINQGPDTQFSEVTKDIFGEAKFISRVIKARDINNDDIVDLIIGTTYQTQSQLYLGSGNGTFKNVTSTNFPKKNASVGDIEIGDVDFDGDLDLVLTDWGPGNNMSNAGGRTMLWLNDGFGNFTDVTDTQMPDILIQFSWDLEFIDFDNDFDLDIAISCKRCGNSRLFQNDGDGNFKNIRGLPAYTNNYDFEPMDVNSDGYLDLVTINDGDIVDGKSSSRREHLFINKEGNYFVDTTTVLWPDTENIGKDDNNVVFLDYDSDGDADFLVSSLTGEDRLLENDGNGRFKLFQPVLKGSPTPLTLSIAVSDINNDGKLDIVMGQGEGSEGIEERIFIGNTILKDSAPPIISHISKELDSIDNTIEIRARIHDNKSPNMPQDWKSIEIIMGNETFGTPLRWYGENLWWVKVPEVNDKALTICATDANGNKTCKDVSQ
ncbi:FG-GAP repeat domain-containing protein [Aegicerativicinus sediminis]|uniref:FG-GAP repeat domain-containing protein n=1 Tax=Aegicerativicinus sediminis TaxID=2893202 RepID=UPI001E538A2B|nr:VCBS repeat-containing protein [Aegicerativicinus sediminis]